MNYLAQCLSFRRNLQGIGIILPQSCASQVEKLVSPKRPRPPAFSREPMNAQKPSFASKISRARSLDFLPSGDASLWRKAIGGSDVAATKCTQSYGWKSANFQFNSPKGSPGGKRVPFMFCKHVRTVGFVFVLLGSFFLLDSLMMSLAHRLNHQSHVHRRSSSLQNGKIKSSNNEGSPKVMYKRLLDLASKALVEDQPRQDSTTLWKEPYEQASAWKPCADKDDLKIRGGTVKSTGYILVSANGGLNQQRVAVCNAVAVASLLNATLVLPKFLYSSVWKDPSQFGDIYQEDYFINYLKNDVNIVKELPSHLQSLDMEAIGSLITDADIMKEAKPIYFVREILPILLKNGVVHFLGFGNRLGFDPIPSQLQRLRCKCNFHALKFVPKIQKVGSLLVRRIRKYDGLQTLLDKHFFGKFMPSIPEKQHEASRGPYKYLALHLRFEMDMVAYSLCDFGGGENERKELQAYRETHFPLLVKRTKETKFPSPSELRKLGRCPLTPEEAALMLSALSFQRRTYIYLAGSHLYGGQSRMLPFTSLYPNLITKEDLLTPAELAPFMNFSSQMAALDLIACATSDVFAMTDSGSQLSSLVMGYRTYYGDGHAPTLRPNKKRFAAILSENGTIEWKEFEERSRKMMDETQRVLVRRKGRSIYRQPRCPECMCKTR